MLSSPVAWPNSALGSGCLCDQSFLCPYPSISQHLFLPKLPKPFLSHPRFLTPCPVSAVPPELPFPGIPFPVKDGFKSCSQHGEVSHLDSGVMALLGQPSAGLVMVFVHSMVWIPTCFLPLSCSGLTELGLSWADGSNDGSMRRALEGLHKALFGLPPAIFFMKSSVVVQISFSHITQQYHFLRMGM